MLGAGEEEEEEEEEEGEVGRGNGDGDGEGGRLRNFLDVECFCGQVMGMSSKGGSFLFYRVIVRWISSIVGIREKRGREGVWTHDFHPDVDLGLKFICSLSLAILDSLFPSSLCSCQNVFSSDLYGKVPTTITAQNEKDSGP